MRDGAMRKTKCGKKESKSGVTRKSEKGRSELLRNRRKCIARRRWNLRRTKDGVNNDDPSDDVVYRNTIVLTNCYTARVFFKPFIKLRDWDRFGRVVLYLLQLWVFMALVGRRFLEQYVRNGLGSERGVDL